MSPEEPIAPPTELEEAEIVARVRALLADPSSAARLRALLAEPAAAGVAARRRTILAGLDPEKAERQSAGSPLARAEADHAAKAARVRALLAGKNPEETAMLVQLRALLADPEEAERQARVRALLAGAPLAG
jgi:hypothetical protein